MTRVSCVARDGDRESRAAKDAKCAQAWKENFGLEQPGAVHPMSYDHRMMIVI
jgi:hypothetical protein